MQNEYLAVSLEVPTEPIVLPDGRVIGITSWQVTKERGELVRVTLSGFFLPAMVLQGEDTAAPEEDTSINPDALTHTAQAHSRFSAQGGCVMVAPPPERDE